MNKTPSNNGTRETVALIDLDLQIALIDLDHFIKILWLLQILVRFMEISPTKNFTFVRLVFEL